MSSGANSALAILAYISGIALAVLAAAQADLTAVVIVALVFLALASALMVPGVWNWWREALPRAQLRRKEGLRPVTEVETDQHPSDLPNGVYGYDEIFAMQGLRGHEARIKPTPVAPDGHAYAIEVHKLADETYLVGWVSVSDQQFLAGTAEFRLILWMHRQRKKLAGVLVEVPLSRVVSDGESRGDGSRKNGFRLVVELGEATNVAPGSSRPDVYLSENAVAVETKSLQQSSQRGRRWFNAATMSFSIGLVLLVLGSVLAFGSFPRLPNASVSGAAFVAFGGGGASAIAIESKVFLSAYPGRAGAPVGADQLSYAVVACADLSGTNPSDSNTIRLGLFLSGDAQLERVDAHTSGVAVEVSTTKVVLPDGSSATWQALFFNLPVERCAPTVPAALGGAAIQIIGTTKSRFLHEHAGDGLFQFPRMGTRLNGSEPISVNGAAWQTPLWQSLALDAGPLSDVDRIDLAAPALSGAGELSWTSDRSFRPIARWTSIRSEKEAQIATLLIGVLLGIGGSFLVAGLVSFLPPIPIRRRTDGDT